MTRPSRPGRRPSLPAPPYGRTGLLALAVALAGLLVANMVPDGPASRLAHAQTAGSSIEYAENGTVPVGVFVAYDQDGDAIVWSLSGPDDGLFTIDGGVLSFREPPDHEDPRSAQGGNVYRVTVEASGGAHDVDVTVSDVDEAGTVSIDRPQPQAERPLGASLSDEDEGVAVQRWQWARSGDGATWTDIEGATSPRRSPAPEDVGMYLRATVTYSDRFGPGKTASAVSARRVEAKTLSNAAPSFAEQDDDEDTPYIDVARSIEENAAVGRPIGRSVSAMDADEDILFYELLDTPDLEDNDSVARFTIDSLSGQIRVGKVLGADSCNGRDDSGEHEDEDSTVLPGVPGLPESEDPRAKGNGKYVLRVRASDPSTATATVNVIVTFTNVNEPPRFNENAPTVLRVRENADPQIVTVGDTDATEGPATPATDQDCVDSSIAYSLTGDDLERLDFIQDERGLAVGRQLDYEEQSSYSLTVVASSGKGLRSLTATLDVTLEVVDEEDPGEVSLSQREPQIGTEVYATVTDPDGGVRISTWAWERSAEVTVDEEGNPLEECRDAPGTPDVEVVGGWTPIDGASSSVYTARPADVGRCLRATTTYTDNMENPAGASDERLTGTVEAPVQGRSPANAAPHFVGSTDRTSRRVAENTEAGQDIGSPVSAHDEDGDLLIYTLGGADAASFGIARNNGQLKTNSPLDYEARRNYTVEVTAADPSGASESILVTIGVIDRDEPARITGNGTVDIAENATAPVASFSAHDPERRSVRWSLGGRDAGRFTISRGTLRFRKSPNYEEPHSALEGAALVERNVYRVTVAASGGTHDVAVRVMDVDEPGTVGMDRPQPQADRPLSASLRDEDEGVAVERWRWARSEDGITWTEIEGATSPRRSPVPADVDMYLRATVTYSDGFGPGKNASAVSANRVEPMTLFNAAPSFSGQDGNEATPYIEVARSVAENTAVGMPIGKPVSATDADDDVLVYELLYTPDREDDDGHVRFTIDRLSGQIRVAEVLGADGSEREEDDERLDEDSMSLTGSPALPRSENAGVARNSKYVLRVRVTDPSTASATVNVIVTVTEVNEPPAFDDDAPTLVRVRENQKDDMGNPVVPPVINLEDGARSLNAEAFAVTDQDGVVDGSDGYDDTKYNYSVTGADRSLFAVDVTGTLSFRAGREPDYEKKSSHSITIVASSGEGERKLTATLDLTIEVLDTEDEGEVILSHRQPIVGIDLQATASDPDGGMIITRWLWQRTVDDDLTASTKCKDIDNDEDWKAIGGASSDVYVPKVADLGRCLRATVIYTDNLSDADQEATGVLEVPVDVLQVHGPDPIPSVNAAPVFPDQDFLTAGDQSDSTSRTVPENTKSGQNIGDPVSAFDADGDLLVYTLSGPDASSFRISRNDGQLRTRSPLNYEARNIYTVVVTATDGIGASDSIQVAINVTDEDDPAVITVNTDGNEGGP